MAYNEGVEFIDLFPQTNINGIQDIGNILSYSTINVTIPAPSSNVTTQAITISTTASQVSAPVYMFLTSTGGTSLEDYLTIDQFQVQTNSLIITRLYAWPTNSINVVLIFKEEGVISQNA